MSETRKWTVLTALGAIVVLVAGWFLLVAPQRNRVSDLKSQNTAAEGSNAALRSKLVQLKAQAADLPEVDARISELDLRIPKTPAEPALIRSLSVAAKSAGVTLVSIAPQPMVPYVAPVSTTAVVAAPVASPAPEPTGTTAATTVAAALPAPTLQVIPMSLTVSGDYTGAKLFVAQLEKLKRSFLVTGFDLTTADDAGAGEVSGGADSNTGSANGDISLVLNGNVFVASATAPVAAPVAATAAPPTGSSVSPSPSASAN